MAEPQQMRWASALSQRVDPRQAVLEASETVLQALGGTPDLALLFVSSHYASSFDSIPGWAQALLSPRHLLGCSGTGVVGAGTEVERREALSIIAARLPGVELFPFHVEAVPRAPAPEVWHELTGLGTDAAAGLVLLADPLSIETEGLLKGLDAAYPTVPKIGGLLSGLDAPGDGALFLGDRLLRHGALGLGLRGRITLSTVVAQGCRPVGDPMIITRCRGSVIYELNVGRPVDALQRLFERLEPRDQELCRHSLFLGIEMGRGSHSYGHGDFLVRNLGGLEPKNGAMAVEGQCSNYQVVQFLLRDARTSAQDLELRLGELHRREPSGSARAALLFSCVGRGQELYGAPNHDSDAFCGQMGPLPLAGFFANGEIGPVGGQSFLHGYTSVFGVFGEPPVARPPSQPASVSGR
jgi:small ligand-binding sensory domain FIST